MKDFAKNVAQIVPCSANIICLDASQPLRNVALPDQHMRAAVGLYFYYLGIYFKLHFPYVLVRCKTSLSLRTFKVKTLNYGCFV